MPPHDDVGPLRFYTTNNIGDPLERNITYSTTTGNTDGRNLYTTTYTLPDDWIQDAWTTYADINRVNINGVDTNTIHLDVDYLGHKVRLELDKILDQYFRSIYKVIQEHVRMDVSEDEFIKLIEENKDE